MYVCFYLAWHVAVWDLFLLLLCMSGPVGATLGLMGIIFYLVSGVARGVNLAFRAKQPMSAKYTSKPLSSSSIAPGFEPALVAQQCNNGVSFRSVLRVHSDLQSIWNNIMTSIYAQKEALSGRYGANIACVNDTFLRILAMIRVILLI